MPDPIVVYRIGGRIELHADYVAKEISIAWVGSQIGALSETFVVRLGFKPKPREVLQYSKLNLSECTVVGEDIKLRVLYYDPTMKLYVVVREKPWGRFVYFACQFRFILAGLKVSMFRYANRRGWACTPEGTTYHWRNFIQPRPFCEWCKYRVPARESMRMYEGRLVCSACWENILSGDVEEAQL